MNLLYPLRYAASRHGHQAAILDGDTAVTYRDFYEQVKRGAAYLRSLGFERGDRLAVLLHNCPAYLELYFSTAMAGIVIVPVNTRWSNADIVFSLEDSGAKGIIGDLANSPVPCIEYPAPTCACLPAAAFDEPQPEDLAGLFYTSGTTGGPKGVMLTHRNLYAHMLMIACHGGGTFKRFLHVCPMFHLADLASLYAVTCKGGAHCFIPTFDPESVPRAIERYKVDRMVLVPTMINMVVNHPNFDKYDVSSLNTLLYGASPMPPSLLELAMRKFKCEFMQAYGMTELSPIVTILCHEDHRFENMETRFTPLKSAGRPILGCEVRVVDDLDRELQTGEIGEIVVRGDTVMKGYWNRPEVNAEVLRGGWMHTGDMGAFDEQGFLYVLDRKKDMIKTGGENVYSPEVEAMVMSHPAVLEAAMIGLPHEKWGETIRAVIVKRPGAELCETEMIAWCRQRLTHFKCPTSVLFLDTLPKGGSGKVMKNVLRRLPDKVT